MATRGSWENTTTTSLNDGWLRLLGVGNRSSLLPLAVSKSQGVGNRSVFAWVFLPFYRKTIVKSTIIWALWIGEREISLVILSPDLFNVCALKTGSQSRYSMLLLLPCFQFTPCDSQFSRRFDIQTDIHHLINLFFGECTFPK